MGGDGKNSFRSEWDWSEFLQERVGVTLKKKNSIHTSMPEHKSYKSDKVMFHKQKRKKKKKKTFPTVVGHNVQLTVDLASSLKYFQTNI